MIRALLPLALLAVAAAPAPKIDPLAPITLRPGSNRVPGFLPGGGAATIIEAWRGNGNAHGYHVWMVLTGPSEGNPVGVASTADGGEIIRDAPFDGERVLGTVRFARATIGGAPASLVLSARLDTTPVRPLADHEHASVRVDRLVKTGDGIGPPLQFRTIATLHSERRYCNADLALRDLLGVPLPVGFSGANRTDGCSVR
ncbi:hypothetical protein [Sphingomonas sp. GC_Shp_3]|uniref:hypothetical protein n=1 Tax=Sphingomonas sp. GC_Shp_3 TaxID=2937383 RepID=UPI00226AC4A6|nr:hypothetical protein [Sphingomonas sp. GC_Shp_3]